MKVVNGHYITITTTKTGGTECAVRIMRSRMGLCERLPLTFAKLLCNKCVVLIK